MAGLRVSIFIFFIVISFQCYSQGSNLLIGDSNWYDALHKQLKILGEDTNRVIILNQLAHYHKFYRSDSGIYYGYRALALSRQIEYIHGELGALHVLALSYRTLGNYSKALQINLEGLRKAEKYNIIHRKGQFRFNIGIIHVLSGEYNKGLIDLRESIPILELTEYELIILAETWIARAYTEIGRTDSAFYFGHKAFAKAVDNNQPWLLIWPARQLGDLHYRLQNLDSANYYFKTAIRDAFPSNNVSIGSNSALSMAKLFFQMNQNDSTAYYAHFAHETAITGGLLSETIDASRFLAKLYKETDLPKSLSFSEMAIVYKDSLDQLRQNTSLGDILDFDEQQRQYELDAIRSEFQSRLRINVLLGSSFTLLVIAFFLFRNNRRKQKAKKKIQFAYERLKNTQAQLIHSEKMASLGELTAGIAHEIQNPLNFVNNFSEVNSELVEELIDEIRKDNLKETEAIAQDIMDNEQKIQYHGKRADSIVKGMLQHSRTSTGEKESTDINSLCDEYLRLAYHGLRAKDKSFNADFRTELDTDLPKINIIPQDIGRVLLNLINNAFQAVAEVEKPEVIVSTKKHDNEIIISVADNGPGIPDEIKDKIFQPFFTTKPTGQGTGLGLSLSYDIVKSHGGEIKVESSENKGSEFIIQLPLKM